MLTEKEIYAINQHIQTEIKDGTYEFDNEKLLAEVVDIIEEFGSKKVCFYNDSVGELAVAVLSEADVQWRLKSDYRITYAFAKKLFGLEQESYSGKSDILFAKKVDEKDVESLFKEADKVVLISPSFSVANLNKFVYDIDLRMYSAIITKKIRGLRANDIIADDFMKDEDD